LPDGSEKNHENTQCAYWERSLPQMA
jgi:hypothetical protein